MEHLAGKPSFRAQQNANNRAISFTGSLAPCDADISSYCCFLTGSRKNAPAGGSRPYFYLKESRLKYTQHPPAFADGYMVGESDCSGCQHARLESGTALPNTHQWQINSLEIVLAEKLRHSPYNNVLIRSGEALGIGWSPNMLYSGFNVLPRSVFWSADFNGRSDNTDVIRLKEFSCGPYSQIFFCLCLNW